MAKRKGRMVVNQHIGMIDEQAHVKDEGLKHDATNTYEHWRESNGEAEEPSVANPDNLTDTTENRLWGEGISAELAGRIIEEFSDGLGNFPILSEQENLVLRVYLITGSIDEVCNRVRLADGKKISRSSVNTYMARIRRKMLRLLKSRDF